MERKFDESFKTPMQFVPDGLHISRRAYTRQQAAEMFQECLRDEVFPESADDIIVTPDELNESWVRWGFQSFSEALPRCCWLVCNKNDHAAQPTWELI